MVSVLNVCTRKRARRAGAGIALVASLALAGCQTTSGPFGGETDNLTTGSTSNALDQTTQLAQAWEANPGDADTAIAYADALQQIGSNDRSVGILQQTARQNPGHAGIHAALGKRLADAGQFDEASEALYTAISLGGGDWQLYSTQGTVLDRLGHHTRAREYYTAALQVAPNEPAVLNNQAMSYALDGSPEKAEEILRDGLTHTPSGEGAVTMRQNLALVLGLQGKFDEARTLLSQDLPPAQVEANLAYMRSIVSQPDTWQQLQGADG